MNSVSGRMVGTTSALSSILPRGVRTRTRSSLLMPSLAAACGWISTQGSGAWLFRKPMRRVWLPLR